MTRIALISLSLLVTVSCSNRRAVPPLGKVSELAPVPVQIPRGPDQFLLRDAVETTISCIAVRALGTDGFLAFLKANHVAEPKLGGYTKWYIEMYTGCESIVRQELSDR